MRLPVEEQDPRTRPIIACAIEVHDALGPGLLEAPYHAAMQIALTSADSTLQPPVRNGGNQGVSL